MKLAIIADIHDNRLYLEKCRQYCEKNSIEAVLCAGDIVSNETVERLEDFNVPVYLIRGNADLFDDNMFRSLPSLRYLGRTGEVALGGKNIGLCHEPSFLNGLLTKNYDIIFYGHIHKPWLEARGKTLIVNPGTLSGHPTLSTFAVWDTDKPVPELIQTDLA